MIVIRISIALAVLFTAFSATAASFWTQLNSGNINNQPLAIEVKTETTPRGGMLFYVYIDPKKATLSLNLIASLTVEGGRTFFRRRKQIVRVEIRKQEYDKGVRFVFEVSSKYLVQSKFQFKDFGGPERNPWLHDVYYFYLKDFASEK
jgi:hypothetical protein